jgi:hypothetical protein
VIYLSRRYLDHLGLTSFDSQKRHHDVCDSVGVHLGEWIFGPAAFPDAPWDRLDPAYLSGLDAHREPAPKRADAVAWRRTATAFIDRQAAATDWSRYDAAGFANSYSQLNASAAPANPIRRVHPGVRLIMGGCGCADPMGQGV